MKLTIKKTILGLGLGCTLVLSVEIWMVFNEIRRISGISQDLSKVEKDTDRDFWMNADESVEYGLISKIISKRAELEI